MSMKEESSIGKVRVATFSGLKADYTTWHKQFLAYAQISGYWSILVGRETDIPTEA